MPALRPTRPGPCLVCQTRSLNGAQRSVSRSQIISPNHFWHIRRPIAFPIMSSMSRKFGANSRFCTPVSAWEGFASQHRCQRPRMKSSTAQAKSSVVYKMHDAEDWSKRRCNGQLVGPSQVPVGFMLSSTVRRRSHKREPKQDLYSAEFSTATL